MPPTRTKVPAAVERFLNFINRSPTPFHAVSNTVQRLEAVGFKRLKETSDWNHQLECGGKYYLTRNQSSIIAFAVGGEYKPANGIAIVGCHTDSPCFKIRPVSKKTHSGYLQVGVETYGGGIWPTWFDRDLGVAGRVIVKDPSSTVEKPVFTSHLVNVSTPILRFPTLAIHLDRTQSDQIKCNLETQMVPILALATDTLNKPLKGQADPNDCEKDQFQSSVQDHHHHLLLSILAGELCSSTVQGQIKEDDIHDLELSLYDTNPSTVGGGLSEFIFSPRLDNLFSSFSAVEALVQFVSGENLEGFHKSPLIQMIALWDNEEIGSVSFQGAESNFLEAVINRIQGSWNHNLSNAIEQTFASSFLLSCDMGHAIHPCYPEKHEENHKPMINRGPAIKTNAKQRYASTAATRFIIKRVAALANVPLQEYEVRNDSTCGSTIGPLVSKVGLRTADIGCPQLSMHSIREQAGCQDLVYLIDLFIGFFKRFHLVHSSLNTGELDD